MRLFIALEAAPELLPGLQNSLTKFRRMSPAGVNWVKPENLHLTLLFLGDVADDLAPEIAESISKTLANAKGYQLAATGYKLFPANMPRMIWLSLKEADRELFQLNRNLLKAMRELKIDADGKPLLPHITIGRIKHQQSPEFERMVMSEPIDNSFYTCDTITLYRSTLKPDGPVYTPIQQFNLK